ncbi:MAG: glutamine--tRNA ligase, partial [Betaproteobacteria bacterium]|nr:glutamine--tRNA ligase [Betaproteobacteria bacterium]
MAAVNKPGQPSASNFIRQIVEADLASGKTKEVVTRFPPEPNGYLHFGHAKSICINFGLPQEYGGRCNLRFDDTNPTKEEQEYVDAIKEAVHWLGFEWKPHEYFASDYFEKLYQFATALIERGHAYVDSQSADELSKNRGTLTQPGKDSRYRNRPVSESLLLLREMREGKHPDGSHVLRAKIDMRSPNMNLRDPVMYRIRHAHHHRTGDKWCIYPTYDWAHGLSDCIENVTHSLCTLEFEDHRPLYDWFNERVADAGLLARPLSRQIEFARLNLTYVVLSKRMLIQLVDEKHVSGWDDPRMPTLAGGR